MKRKFWVLFIVLMLWLSVLYGDSKVRSSGVVAYQKKSIDWMQNQQIVKALDLSTAQWKKISRLKSNLQKKLIALGAALSIKKIELKGSWMEVNLDEVKIRKLVDEIASIQTKMYKASELYRLDGIKLLTAKQNKILKGFRSNPGEQMKRIDAQQKKKKDADQKKRKREKEKKDKEKAKKASENKTSTK